jgi:hypothetical protein
MNQSIHGGWDSANGPVSPRRNRLREWTRTASIDRADKYRLAFDTTITDEAQFMHRQGHRLKLTAQTTVGDGFVKFNKEGTRWLGVRMDAHLTFKEHHNHCMTARAAEACLGALTTTNRVVQACVRAIQRA